MTPDKRYGVVLAGICLCLAHAVRAEPPCTAAMDGLVAPGGCRCGYDRGGVLTGRAAGWQWICDVLRGTADMPEPAADPDAPSGFGY